MNFTREDVEDLQTRREKTGRIIINLFLEGHGRYSWPTIKAARLKRIWLDYGRSGVVRDEKGLAAIADSMLDGIARLDFTTEMLGHTEAKPEFTLEDMGYNFSEKDMEQLYEFLTFKNGDFMLSDYGLPQLEKLYPSILRADNSEHLLFAIDRALNIIHQRGDFAAFFVEGGNKNFSGNCQPGRLLI